MDQKEQIKTEIIIIDDDDPIQRETTKNGAESHVTVSKNRKKKIEGDSAHKRKVTLETHDNTEKLLVTQRVKVKRQKIQCIINLTNVCQNKERKKKEKLIKHKFRQNLEGQENVVVLENVKKQVNVKRQDHIEGQDHVKEQDNVKGSEHVKGQDCVKRQDRVKRISKDRVVPHCLRKKCQNAISSKCRRKPPRKHERKPKANTKVISKRTKVATKSKCHADLKTLLSPISSPVINFDDDEDKCNKLDMSYDNISSDSMSAYDVDENLNDLIKRTKNRERKLITPTISELPAVTLEEKLACSPSDTDFHSITTIMLDSPSKNSIYSPTQSPGAISIVDDNSSLIASPINFYSPIYPIISPLRLKKVLPLASTEINDSYQSDSVDETFNENNIKSMNKKFIDNTILICSSDEEMLTPEKHKTVQYSPITSHPDHKEYMTHDVKKIEEPLNLTSDEKMLTRERHKTVKYSTITKHPDNKEYTTYDVNKNTEPPNLTSFGYVNDCNLPLSFKFHNKYEAYSPTASLDSVISYEESKDCNHQILVKTESNFNDINNTLYESATMDDKKNIL